MGEAFLRGAVAALGSLAGAIITMLADTTRSCTHLVDPAAPPVLAFVEEVLTVGPDRSHAANGSIPSTTVSKRIE